MGNDDTAVLEVENGQPNDEDANNEVIENEHTVDNGGVKVKFKNGSTPAEKEEGDGKSSKPEKEPEPPKVGFFKLFRYATALEYFIMIMAIVFSIINGLAQPASFIIFGRLIEEFVDFDRTGGIDLNVYEAMKEFAVYFVVLAAVMFICAFLQAGMWSFSAARQTHKIRTAFFRAILRQDIGWYDTHEPGTLTTRLSDDLLKIQTGIGDKVGLTVQAVVMFCAGFAVGFFYSWKLTLVILATTPLMGIFGAIVGKVMMSMSADEQAAYASAGAVAEETISSIRTVAAFGGEHDEIKRYDEKLAEAETSAIWKSAYLGGSFGGFYFVIFGIYALAFWYGSKLLSEGEINAGELMIVFFCIMAGAEQLGTIETSIEAITAARGVAHFVFDVCDRTPPIDCLSDEGEKIDKSKLAGEIKFTNVNFNYPSRPEVQILKDFDLVIRPGSTVALVGESGCGKSTVVKLIQRFYDVMQGDVSLDGSNLKSLNVHNYRSNIGVVSQEPVLFNMTIRESIAFGSLEEVSDNDIVKAAKEANAHDFIKAMPKGYDTRVGEGGTQLSGGQKQRIAIARALVRNPKILLFDEATSALDTESELSVQAALDKASKGRTTVLIAHRLSTVKNADVIIAMKDGQVAEQGTHKELLQQNGVYFQLVELQQSGGVMDGGVDVKESKPQLERNLSIASDKSTPSKPLLGKQLSTISASKEKEEEIEKPKVKPAPIMEIIRLHGNEWPYIAVGCVFSVIAGAFPILFAVVLSELINVFSKPNVLDLAVKWCLYFLGLGVIDGIAVFLSSLLFGISGAKLTRRIRRDAFSAIIRQDIGFFDEPLHNTGVLTAQLASDASTIHGATSSRLNLLIQVFTMGVTILVVAFSNSWQVTLVVFAFIPILVLSGMAYMMIFQNFAQNQGKHFVDSSAVAHEAINNVRTVATLGREEYFYNKFESQLIGPYKKSTRNAFIFGLTYGLTGSIMQLAMAAAFTLGGKLVQEDEITHNQMFKVVFTTVFGALIAGTVTASISNYAEAKISAMRILTLLKTEPKIDSFSENGHRKENVEGEVKFKNISFKYPSRPELTILKDVSFDIKPGQKVALVGSSGCGKSTSISLLERFYDPASGSIKLDGSEIKELNLRWLRSQIGLVSQEPVLFARTIRQNIVYGLSDEVTDEEVERAATNANIHSFISGLPQGYSTMVGDKGTLISGGQKQRIAIARALIRDPKIMLLDEATSALDSESEKVVQNALDKAMEGRTSIIIAHRLSTVKNADVIIVIQDGGVIEVGTHNELIAQRGAYYALNQAQL